MGLRYPSQSISKKGNVPSVHSFHGSVTPFLGRARGGGLGLRFGFRNGVFPRLSPLFHEGVQFFYFPALISCLGEQYLAAAGEHLH